MVRCSGDRETRDRGRVASGWLSPVLALAIPAARRSTQGEPGGADSHRTPSERELGLGRTEDPWRTAETWLRGLRTNGSQIFETPPTSQGSWQELADLLGQSSRGDRRHGLLHRAHAELQPTVWLLCHRTLAATYPKTSTSHLIRVRHG